MRQNLMPLLIVLVGLAGLTQVQPRAMAAYTSAQKYEAVYYLPSPDWLRVMALGYREALADLIWMKALIYYGDELIHSGGASNACDYAEAMSALDPQFKRPYQWVAVAGMYNPTGIVPKDVMLRVSRLLTRGVEQFPEDGHTWWTAGSTIRFDVVPELDINDPIREQLAEKAAEYLQKAALLGGGPEWLALTNSAELVRLGKTETAVAHLEAQLAATKDPALRERIAARIADLRGAAYAEAIRASVDEFNRNHARDFPYVSSDMYMLLGPRIDGYPSRTRETH